MTAIFMFSFDGLRSATVACTDGDWKNHTFDVMSLKDVERHALVRIPILFRQLEKHEAAGLDPGADVAVIKKFDLPKVSSNAAELNLLTRILKCYYKRAASIRGGLEGELMDYIFEHWDFSQISPKVFKRLMPKTRAEAQMVKNAMATWFPETDFVCKFLARAMSEWLPEKSGVKGIE
jgi:hypothetical protein